MGNLITKIIQTSIQINGKLQFSHVWDGETSENFIHCFKCKINVFQIRIFEGITLLLFIIYGFIKIKVLSTMLFFHDSGKFLDFSKQRPWVRAPVSAESGNNLPYLGKPDTFYKRLQVGVNSFIP